MTTTPNGLGPGGSALWREITDEHDLDVTQRAQLEEACRAKDRCDRLDEILRGDLDAWMWISDGVGGKPATIVVNKVLEQANATANLMKQLLAALRLPDAQSGKRPQYRGPRGAQKPSTPGGKVSSLERARAAKTGS